MQEAGSSLTLLKAVLFECLEMIWALQGLMMLPVLQYLSTGLTRLESYSGLMVETVASLLTSIGAAAGKGWAAAAA